MKRIITTFILMASMIAIVSAQSLTVTRHAFDGKFKNTKITVSIWIEETTDGDLSGEIVYTSSKQKTPIRVFGKANDLPNGNRRMFLTEYQADGNQTGFFSIERNPKTGALSGEWNASAYDEKRTYNMQLRKVPFPNGKGGTFTYNNDISGKFVYNRSHPVKGEQGGMVEINYLRGAPGKVSLKISKYDPQLADYENNVYFKNSHFSDEIEDCGYRFTVDVFQDFVLVKTTSDEPSYDCFGAWTTLEGIYLKTENR